MPQGAVLVGVPLGCPYCASMGAPMGESSTNNNAMAGVVKKAGRADWYAVWKVGRKNIRKSTHVAIKQEGKTERQTKKEARIVADAMEAVAKGNSTLERQIDALRAAAAASGHAAKVPSVVEYVESYHIGGGEQNRLNTTRALRMFMQYLGAASMQRIDRVTREQVQGFITEQVERVRSSTVSKYVQSISAVFNAAVDSGLMMKNPCRGCKVPRETSGVFARRDAFTAAEIALMLEKLPRAWADMVLVCLGTGGQRIGDCARLLWSAVDFKQGVIRIVTDKTGAVIENPLVEPLAARLLELWNEREEDSPYVFPSMARRYTRSSGSLSMEFVALLKGLGIAREMTGGGTGDRRSVSTKSFHGLRRAAVSLMRDAGASADMSRAIVGHESEAVERSYYRASMDGKRAVLGGMMAAITGTQAAPAGGADARKEA